MNSSKLKEEPLDLSTATQPALNMAATLTEAARTLKRDLTLLQQHNNPFRSMILNPAAAAGLNLNLLPAMVPPHLLYAAYGPAAAASAPAAMPPLPNLQALSALLSLQAATAASLPNSALALQQQLSPVSQHTVPSSAVTLNTTVSSPSSHSATAGTPIHTILPQPSPPGGLNAATLSAIISAAQSQMQQQKATTPEKTGELPMKQLRSANEQHHPELPPSVDASGPAAADLTALLNLPLVDLKNARSTFSATISARNGGHTSLECFCGEHFKDLCDLAIHMKKDGHTSTACLKGGVKRADMPRKFVRGQDMWIIGRNSAETQKIMSCMSCGESFKSLPELTLHMMQTEHYWKIAPPAEIRSALRTARGTKETKSEGPMSPNNAPTRASSDEAGVPIPPTCHPRLHLRESASPTLEREQHTRGSESNLESAMTLTCALCQSEFHTSREYGLHVASCALRISDGQAGPKRSMNSPPLSVNRKRRSPSDASHKGSKRTRIAEIFPTLRANSVSPLPATKTSSLSSPPSSNEPAELESGEFIDVVGEPDDAPLIKQEDDEYSSDPDTPAPTLEASVTPAEAAASASSTLSCLESVSARYTAPERKLEKALLADMPPSKDAEAKETIAAVSDETEATTTSASVHPLSHLQSLIAKQSEKPPAKSKQIKQFLDTFSQFNLDAPSDLCLSESDSANNNPLQKLMDYSANVKSEKRKKYRCKHCEAQFDCSMSIHHHKIREHPNVRESSPKKEESMETVFERYYNLAKQMTAKSEIASK